MDLDIEIVELSNEEKEKYEFLEKLENGEIQPVDQPLEFYLEKHPDSYRLIRECMDYIVNELEIKIVGELLDKFDDFVKDRLLETFPHLCDENNLNRLLDEISDMRVDAYIAVDIEP